MEAAINLTNGLIDVKIDQEIKNFSQNLGCKECGTSYGKLEPIATPTSIMVGTGRAAEMGVLFRKGDALQQLSTVDVVALDKTGTVTEGRPELTQEMAQDLDYAQQTLIPKSSESHSGVDVALYAKGPWAHLFDGTIEQNYIFHVMNYAVNAE